MWSWHVQAACRKHRSADPRMWRCACRSTRWGGVFVLLVVCLCVCVTAAFWRRACVRACCAGGGGGSGLSARGTLPAPSTTTTSLGPTHTHAPTTTATHTKKQTLSQKTKSLTAEKYLHEGWQCGRVVGTMLLSSLPYAFLLMSTGFIEVVVSLLLRVLCVGVCAGVWRVAGEAPPLSHTVPFFLLCPPHPHHHHAYTHKTPQHKTQTK